LQAFGRAVNEQDMLSAIATYERTLASFDSLFDHFIAGEANAISDSAKRGWDLFNTKARCNLCHALTEDHQDATLFMDNDFHNIGVGILRHHVVPLASEPSASWRKEIFLRSTSRRSPAICRCSDASS